MQVTYGKTTPTSATDPEVRAVHQLFERFRTALRPGAYLVDSIPWLKYLPWYGQELKQEFERSRQIYSNQLNRVKQQIVCIALQNFHMMSESFHSRTMWTSALRS